MKYLTLLKKLAAKSDHHQHQMSCIVVRKNKVISVGWNQNKTDPNTNHPYKFIHAEWHALARLTPEDTKGCTVYIYRENKNGVLSMSRPCPSCSLALQKAQIRRIIFTCDSTWKEESYN